MFEGKRRWVSQLRQSEFTLHLLFCSMQPLNGLDGAHSRWWGWSIPCKDSNAKLLQKPSQTHPEMTLYRFSGHPMARPSWYIKWSVTGMMTGNLCKRTGEKGAGQYYCTEKATKPSRRWAVCKLEAPSPLKLVVCGGHWVKYFCISQRLTVMVPKSAAHTSVFPTLHTLLLFSR